MNYNTKQNEIHLQPFLWVQLVLVLLPFALFVVFVGWRSWRKFKAFWKQEPLYTYVMINTDDNDELDDFPTRAVEDSIKENTSNIGSASPHLGNTSNAKASSIGTKGGYIVDGGNNDL